MGISGGFEEGLVEANQNTVSNQVNQMKEMTDCHGTCSSHHGFSQMTRVPEETQQQGKRIVTIEEWLKRWWVTCAHCLIWMLLKKCDATCTHDFKAVQNWKSDIFLSPVHILVLPFPLCLIVLVAQRNARTTPTSSSTWTTPLPNAFNSSMSLFEFWRLYNVATSSKLTNDQYQGPLKMVEIL